MIANATQLNISVYTLFICSVVLWTGVSVISPAHASLSIATDIKSATWKVSPPDGQPESNNRGFQIGVKLKIKFDKLYTGLDFSTGQYDVGSQDASAVATNNLDDKLTRTESNVVLGYYVFKHLSVFSKYKSLDFDNGESYRLTSPGLGLQLHYTLSSHWLLFTNFAKFVGDFTIGDNNAGDIDITELALGAAYRPALRSYIGVSFSYQKLEYQYETNGTETHQLSGLLVSYNYVF